MAVIVIIFVVMVLSPTFTNNIITHGQLASNSQTSAIKGVQKIHGVKIVSPSRGQQISIYKNLTIIGTSVDNATSNCQVNIIVNGVKPYQQVQPAGLGGATDYSLWNYTLTPKYTTIKEGINQLKARFSCNDNPNLVSYYTANVTAIALHNNSNRR
jgi:hypothetical protein